MRHRRSGHWPTIVVAISGDGEILVGTKANGHDATSMTAQVGFGCGNHRQGRTS